VEKEVTSAAIRRKIKSFKMIGGKSIQACATQNIPKNRL
jgi:hypothetical protein